MCRLHRDMTASNRAVIVNYCSHGECLNSVGEKGGLCNRHGQSTSNDGGKCHMVKNTRHGSKRKSGDISKEESDTGLSGGGQTIAKIDAFLSGRCSKS